MALTRLLAPVNRRYGTYRGLIRLALARLQQWLGGLRRYSSPDLSTVRRLVFVCQGNVCRSCFAAATAKSRGIPSASFGLVTTTGVAAHPPAVAAALKRAIDLSAHRVTSIDDFEFAEGDLVLAMEVRQAKRLQLLLPDNVQLALLGLWGTPARPHIHDPFGLSDEYLDTCFHTIERAVAHLGDAWSRAMTGVSTPAQQHPHA